MAPQRKILVTGGLGFIGHNIVQRLESFNHHVIITDTRTNYGSIPHDELDYVIKERLKKIKTKECYLIDIADSDGIDFLLRKHSPDIIVHTASFPRQKTVNANPQAGSRVMSEGLLNLLEASKKHKVRKFIYISSSMVYGDFTDNVREDAVCKPQGQYGIMKLAGEWLVSDYSRRGFFDHVIIRPSAVYGELDVEDRVVSKFLLTAMRGETLEVNGATETLDFTHVDDTTDGIVAAVLSSNGKNKTYNITKSHSWSLLHAANLAIKIVGRGTVEVGNKNPNFPSRGALNIDAARRDFGYDPKIGIEEGFQRYYDWFNSSLYWTPKTV